MCPTGREGRGTAGLSRGWTAGCKQGFWLGFARGSESFQLARLGFNSAKCENNGYNHFWVRVLPNTVIIYQ